MSSLKVIKDKLVYLSGGILEIKALAIGCFYSGKVSELRQGF